ncbi:MAG: dienelactone hydrolase family protein [Flavobacteriales bacterium]|jgi:dienelactone hydrolase|nr:dienelactone hydrolase family protein [Flavobacteriales bacterium]
MTQLISSIVKGSENRPMAVDLRFDDQHPQSPVVIFVHGFKGFKDWGHFPKVGEELVKAGFAFVSFNFTHDGTTIDKPTDFADLEAFGNNNYRKELFDIQVVIDALSDGTLFPETDLNRKKLFLFGHSRGGGMSIVKTSEDDRIKGLVTWASVGSLKRTQVDMEKWKMDGVVYIPNARTNQQMPMYYQFVEDYVAQKERYSLEKCCKEITVPALFIHGSNDSTVPSSDAKKLEEWCSSGKTVLVEKADHTFGGKHPFMDDGLPTHSMTAIDATIKHFRSIS